MAYDTESPEVLVTDVPEDKTALMKQIFNDDYENLAQHINISDKKLLILTPSK
jgi:hypothetical protein